MKLYNTGKELYNEYSSRISTDFTTYFKYNVDSLEQLKEVLKLELSCISTGHLAGIPYHTKYLSDSELHQSLEARRDNLTDIELDSVSYLFNELGFRDKDTIKVNTPSIGVFGCSITFGLGLSYSDTFVSKLDSVYEDKVYNFGIPGANIQNVSRVFCLINNFFKLKKAIFYLPSFYRHQFILDKKAFLLIPSEIRNVKEGVFMPVQKAVDSYSGLTYIEIGKNFYRMYNEDQLAFIFLSDMQIIEQNSKINNTDIVFTTWCPHTFTKIRELGNEDIKQLIHAGPSKKFARDGAHPGKEANLRIFNDIKNLL